MLNLGFVGTINLDLNRFYCVVKWRSRFLWVFYTWCHVFFEEKTLVINPGDLDETCNGNFTGCRAIWFIPIQFLFFVGKYLNCEGTEQCSIQAGPRGVDKEWNLGDQFNFKCCTVHTLYYWVNFEKSVLRPVCDSTILAYLGSILEKKSFDISSQVFGVHLHLGIEFLFPKIRFSGVRISLVT